MKRKILLTIIGTAIASTLITGCASKEVAESGQSQIDVTVTDGDSSDEGNNNISSEKSIQDEMSEMEEKEKANIEKAQLCETQTDMNINASERYEMWDKELNSLWSRLSEEVDSDKKETLLAEQREWIKKKENAVKYAGAEAEGGSIQPLLEAEAGSDMTKVRSYELAKLLAEVRGESFVIPDDIAADLQAKDMSLDDILTSFEGKHIVDEDNGTEIVIEKMADSDFIASDFSPEAKWAIWYTRGDVLTDVDAIEYYPGVVIFKKGESYYSISENMAGGVELKYGTSKDNLEYVMGTDN